MPARDRRALRGTDMSMIFQDPTSSLNPTFRIGGQFVDVIRRGDPRITRGDALARAGEILAHVAIPDPGRVLESYPFQLSGGMNQRVMIAMALVNRPKLLLADEPGTALDVTVQAQTLKLIRDLVEEVGTAVLFISHNLGVVREFADRVYVIYRGRIVETGPTAAIFDNPGHAYTRALLAAVPRITGQGLPDIAEVSDEFLRTRLRSWERCAMTVALSVSNLSKTFHTRSGEVHAVRDVSLDVQTGDCLAIVGESGSGKTTLANMLLGILKPTRGKLVLDGEELPERRAHTHRQAIQFVQQNPLSALNPQRSIGASIRLGLDVYGIGRPSERWSLVEKALHEVGLDPSMRHRAPSALSGGQRQRVGIARALACQSRIIVLDEPTSALDVLVQARVLRLLNDLRREMGADLHLHHA